MLNGHAVKITSSLASALKILSSDVMNGRLGLWVDTICINQSDKHELSREVKRLGNIFAQAWTKTIWIGPERDNSEKAFKMLQTWSECSSDSEFEKIYRPASAYTGTFCLRAMCHLLHRSYWKRIWVLQELIL